MPITTLVQKEFLYSSLSLSHKDWDDVISYVVEETGPRYPGVNHDFSVFYSLEEASLYFKNQCRIRQSRDDSLIELQEKNYAEFVENIVLKDDENYDDVDLWAHDTDNSLEWRDHGHGKLVIFANANDYFHFKLRWL